MSQVLISDDGKTQTSIIFGQDLIYQDNGTEHHYLLSDSLGSVRTELVETVIQSTTTYEPYGKRLTTAGKNGTVYTFTGEELDVASGLLYLRARYYAPMLKVFLSPDPFSGWLLTPASQHGYSYVHNNPVNNIDPTGAMCLFGFSVGPGRGCTAEELAHAAHAYQVIADFFANPAFASGFLVELVDTITASGLTIGSGVFELLLNETAWGQSSEGKLRTWLVQCGVDPDITNVLLNPYTSLHHNPDPYFQLGRAVGRGIALGLALGQVTIGPSGAVAGVAFAGPTGGASLIGSAASVAITTHGALVIGTVIAKEIADPLLMRLPILFAAVHHSPSSPSSGGNNGNHNGSPNQSPSNYSGSPKGLNGHDFEDWLANKYGGITRVRHQGREFDVESPDILIEAKTGWKFANNQKKLARFHSTIGQQQSIAESLGKKLEVHSNVPIPDSIKTWLSGRNVSFIEHLE